MHPYSAMWCDAESFGHRPYILEKGASWGLVGKLRVGRKTYLLRRCFFFLVLTQSLNESVSGSRLSDKLKS